MSVYYVTILAVIICSAFAVENYGTADANGIIKNNHSERLWLFCVAVILILVSGLRYGVGADYFVYYGALERYPTQIIDLIKDLDEPGFPLLVSILRLFTNDGAVFVFITAMFTIGSVLLITYKYTNTYIFASMLFIFTGIWHGSFNGVRQYFAAAIICLAHRFILEKKILKYMICVFIAFLIHSSAIIMVIPYFILRNKVSLKNILILAVGSLILRNNYEFIFSFVGDLKDETMNVANDVYLLNQVNPLRVIVNVVPAVFCVLLHITTPKDKETTFYLNILILYGLLSVIGMNSPYLSRVNIYLGVCQPLAMCKLVVFKDKKIETIVKWIIILLFFGFWYYEVSNGSSLHRFYWIWQR